MSRIHFTAFADLHHMPEWYKSDAPERLAAIQKHAVETHSDLLISLGDFCHIPTREKELIAQYASTPIPTYHTLGNHEFDHDTLEEVLQAYGMPSNYYSFTSNGFRLIVLDNNYFSDFPGLFFHYSQRNYFDHPAGRENFSPEEIAWFRETVLTSKEPCIVFSHASLDYPNTIKNRNEILKIIQESQNTPGRVMLCVNGHHHRNHLSIVNHVAYFDLNSTTFDWIAKPHHFFPEEWYHTCESVGNQIIYNDPLHAIITLDSDDTLDIQGCESSFCHGVSREMTGNSEARFPCESRVLSAHLNLNTAEDR